MTHKQGTNFLAIETLKQGLEIAKA